MPPTIPLPIRRPVTTLVILGLALAVAVGTIVVGGLRVDESTDVFIVKGDAAWRALRRALDLFGDDQAILVGVAGEDPLGPTGLARLERIASAIEEKDARLWRGGTTRRRLVLGVDGLHTVPRARRLMAAGNGAAAAALPLVGDLFVVGDHARPMPVLVVRLPGDLTPEERAAFLAAFGEVRSGEDLQGGEIVAAGAPILDAALAAASSQQGGRLFPFLGAVAFLALLLLTRSLAATAAVLGTTVVTLPVTLATMTLAGRDLNLLTSGLPVVLLVLGSTVSLHVLGALRTRGPTADPSRRLEDVARAIDGIRGPCRVASLTTACGFLALMASEIIPVREMGIFAAVGIFVAWRVALTLLPACGALGWLPARPRGDGVMDDESSSRLHAPAVLVGTLFALVLGGMGMMRITVDSAAIGFLPAGHEVTRDYEELRSRSAPVFGVELLVRVPDVRYFASADVVAHLARAARDARDASPSVRHAVGLPDLLAFLRGEATRRVSERDRERLLQELAKLDADVPADVPRHDGVALAPFVAVLVGVVERPAWMPGLETEGDEVSELLDAWLATRPDGATTRIQIGGVTDEARTVADLLDRLSVIAARLEAAIPGAIVTITGHGPIGVRVQTLLVESQLKSLGLALLLVGTIIFLGLGSLRLTLIAAVPNLLPLAVLYGGMGWFGLPLDAATVMVGAIALGIAVDDTVHVLAHYDPTRAPRRAVSRALRTVRWPVLTTTVMAASGFSVLALSTFVPMIKFGLLVAVAMVLALVADLVVLPAMLIAFGPRREVAELLRFTGRGRFGGWRERVPRRWTVRLRAGFDQLRAGVPADGLATIDRLLSDTRDLEQTHRRQRARAVAEYLRIRCLKALAHAADDPTRARSLDAAVAAHVAGFADRYAEVADVAARVADLDRDHEILR